MDIVSWYKDAQIYSLPISTWLFVFAAGVLFYRAKSVPTAMFFFGALIAACINIPINRIFELHQTDSAGLQLFYKLAMCRDLAFILEVIGLLWYVFTVVENKKADTV